MEHKRRSFEGHTGLCFSRNENKYSEIFALSLILNCVTISHVPLTSQHNLVFCLKAHIVMDANSGEKIFK